MNRTTGLRTAMGVCLSFVAMIGACSSGGNTPEQGSGQPVIEPTSTVRVDPATALRLRELADASVEAAVRTFGPAEGLPLDELGARLFRTRGCMGCHGPGAREQSGPSLINAFGTMRRVEGMRPLLMDLDYINVALMRPDSLIAEGYEPGIMPSYEKSLYPREVLALAVYLQGMSDRPQLPSNDLEPDPDPTPVAVDDTPPATPVNRVEAPLIPDSPPVDVPEERETRHDSRPDWWFDGVRRGEGRVWVCVDALGDSFATARSAVIERGQAMLSEQMGLGPGDELQDVRVKYIQIIPLPNRGVEQRYAGYVLISAIAN
ncbi:MAG: c-type cytochrome [Phycisphaerales bacterium JB065]